MKKDTLIIIFLISLLAPIIAKDTITGSVMFSSAGIIMNNCVVTSDTKGKEVFTLADLTYDANQIPEETDIILSFIAIMSFCLMRDL